MTMPSEKPARRRRRFRPVLTLTLAFVVLFAAWVGVEVYFAYTARPNPAVDYGIKLEEYSKQEQPAGEDGWPVLIGLIEHHNDYINWDGNGSDPIQHPNPGKYKIFSMYSSTKKRLLADDRHDVPVGSEAQLASLEAHYQQALTQIAGWDKAGITERLNELAACDRLIRPFSSSSNTLISSTTGQTAQFLPPFCFALHERMKQARQAGNWDLYIESFHTGLGIAKLISYQPFLYEHISGLQARSLFLKQSIADIEGGTLPEHVRDALQASFDRQRVKMKSSHVIESELYCILDIAQRVYDQRGRLILTELGKYPTVHSGMQTTSRISNIRSLWMPRRQWLETLLREYFEAQKAYVDMPVHERSGEDLTDYERLDVDLVLNGDMEVWGAMIGTPLHLVSHSDRNALLELAFQVVVQLHRYRDDHGVFPPTLQALVPNYLEELPVDPCSALRDALGYIWLDEPDEFGRRYILYSRGRDLEDNGGAIPLEEHPEAPLTTQSLRGFDYVLNHPHVLATH